MVKVNRRIEKILLVCVALIILSSATIGCEYFPESTFELANESRLPRWFNLPPGLNRSDVSVTLNYYSVPWGNDTIFILHDGKGHVLGKIGGNANNREPLHLKSSPTGYPLFEVITANGITEIIEHKKMEPIFYITDDPAVWKELMGVEPSAGNPAITHK
jgi:hypothetical protein